MKLDRKAALGIAAACLAFGLARSLPIHELLRRALAWIGHLGVWAPFAFILAYILACVLFIPASLLTLGAGFVFGFARGVVCVSVGATLGATAAFLVGRYLARDWVSRRLEGNEKFGAVDRAVAREGWKIVLLARLSPAFPFNMLNYAFGLTQVSLRDYFWASWIGMLPATVMYVYLGSLAGDLAALGSAAGRARTPAEWVFYGAGLGATLIATVYVTRVARRALSEREDGLCR